MGRTPSRWSNLPKGMRARERGHKIHYYLDAGGKPRREIPLGSDYVAAVQKWAELTAEVRTVHAVHTFPKIAQEYILRILPTKAPRTQRDNLKELDWLLKFFGNPPAPIDQIEPMHINQYMEWRVQQAKELAMTKNVERKVADQKTLKVPTNIGQVRANREKSLFSHIFNFARKQGYAKAANPCTGVSGFKETARDVVVGDELLRRVLEAGDQALRFSIRLAHLTGQRPADVIRMSEEHITGDILHVRQGKTATKLRIEISGELKTLIEEIREFKQQHMIRSVKLLVTENGTPLTYNSLRNRFDDAREAAAINKADFQFRDLRATAATAVDESAGTRSAQTLLGHTTEAMTSAYIRHKVGRKVAPVK